jgi:hypothetical protein
VSKHKTPITEEAQSKPAAELRRESRLFLIAKALASGATVTDIADAEGIGRTLASREANSPECRQLIAEFVGDEWEEMRAVFYRSMRAIEHALSARRLSCSCGAFGRADLQSLLPIEAVHSFRIHRPTFAAEQDGEPAITVPHPATG